MPSLLDSCEKYYETRDIYKLLGITKNSLEKDIKKAYYKLSLQVHPDRVAEAEKEVATEKFKVLSKLHLILTDKDKKALYDDKGIIDDDDDDSTSWSDLWKQFFKPITTQDINNYQKEYVGSELEMNDIKKAYLNGKGCINYMMNSVPFMAVEDEPRIQDVVKGWIASNEVPEYKIFTEEPKQKRTRRHKKYNAEALEAREMKTKLEATNGGDSLEQQIMKRQEARASEMGGFFDKLMAKYGNEDDSEEFVMTASDVRKKKRKPAKKVADKTKPTKGPEHKVKNGRVTRSTRST